MPEPSYFVEALASTIEATGQVCAGLTDEQWGWPTGCPGWTVKDSVVHLYGLERVLAGEPEPEHELVGDFPHVRSETGRYMERQVDARRALSGAQVLGEFNETWAARLAYLRSLDAEGFASEAPGPMGSKGPLGKSLPIRVFDCWAHEQDIRRAVGRRGGLDTSAAAVSLTTCKRVAPSAIAAVVPDGSTVVFELDGPNGGQLAASYSGGVATVLDGPPDASTVVLAMSDEMFAFLCCGRCDTPPGEVKMTGDTALGETVIGALGFTP
ncbi:MAG TPA: maleylpyruvate isomerase family mycothiol-dependent enzyme [Acidimicrobiales bacterium]|nr:maleylpyruvate isomerase family mycothiol-dependent enzyme [Acidimicrobiales bacterium]